MSEIEKAAQILGTDTALTMLANQLDAARQNGVDVTPAKVSQAMAGLGLTADMVLGSQPEYDVIEPDLPPWERSNERHTVWEAGGDPDDPDEYDPDDIEPEPEYPMSVADHVWTPTQRDPADCAMCDRPQGDHEPLTEAILAEL